MADRFTWEFKQEQLAASMREKDKNDFCNWPTIRESFFSGSTKAAEGQYASLPPFYKDAIKDPGIGNPTLLDDHTSGTYIHQAFYLHSWSTMISRDVKDFDVIIEFGGGYGAMAFVVRALGFSGDYIIVDLPEVLELQKWYLSKAKIDNVIFETQYHGDCDLLIAGCSLSEVDIATREVFLSRITKEHSLIVYQERWADIDNHVWFSRRFPDSIFYRNRYNMNHWFAFK